MVFKWSFKKRKKISNTENNGVNNILNKLKSSLLRTRNIISEKIDTIFNNKKYVNDDILEKLEEVLITADISINTSEGLLESISKYKSNSLNSDDIKKILRKEILKIFRKNEKVNNFYKPPYICMIVGVNGVGKSSTIGKLAALESRKGKKVVIASSDTFRAAASEQMEAYSNQAGAYIIKSNTKSDPASVAYNGISSAIARKADTVFIDTAGRIHTKQNLMNELCKIKRTVKKKIINAPHEIILVVDSTTGQNIMSQVKKFNELLGLTGIIVTKLDGSAKGGVLIDVAKNFNIPIKYITIGEKINDIEKFEPKNFVESLI